MKYTFYIEKHDNIFAYICIYYYKYSFIKQVNIKNKLSRELRRLEKQKTNSELGQQMMCF